LEIFPPKKEYNEKNKQKKSCGWERVYSKNTSNTQNSNGWSSSNKQDNHETTKPKKSGVTTGETTFKYILNI